MDTPRGTYEGTTQPGQTQEHTVRGPHRFTIRLAALLAAGLLLGPLGLFAWLRLSPALTPHTPRLNAMAYNELTAVQADHDSILAATGQCSSPHHPFQLPPRLRIIVPNGTPLPLSTPASSPPITLDSPSYPLAAVSLSDAIGRARIDLAQQKASDYVLMQIFEWLAVIVGAVTTILVSIKAMDSEHTPRFLAIGIAAIIFSALGTGVATLNSFYSFHTTYVQTDHTLATLRQIHLDLALGLMRESGICEPWGNKWPQDWRFKRLKHLADRYAAVMNAGQPNNGQPEENGVTSNSATSQEETITALQPRAAEN